VLRWWSLGEASAHVDGAQMMGKPGVAFRKARRQRLHPCLPDAALPAPPLSTAASSQRAPPRGAAPLEVRTCA